MKKFKIIYLLLLLTTLMGVISGCDKGTKTVNIFSLDDDKQLGNQMVTEIESNPAQYPILDSAQYPAAYGYLNHIIRSILDSGGLLHKNDFNWRFRIIHNDSILNAFAAPGGKIYVYTGIIKYLSGEDELAGVLGHEITHADRRHVTDEMTNQYGLQLLLDIVLGKNQNALTQVAAGLATLKFSRDKEAEADKYAVIFTNNTSYDPLGVGKFFQKLIAQGQGNQGPAFLSDHPSPDNRVQKIHDEWVNLGSKKGSTYTARYQDFINSLPK